MAVAPTLAVAIVGAAFAGIGNGVESVAVRTALQEEVEDQWMALMMSLYEALFQSVPGRRDADRRRDHRPRQPTGGAGRGRRGVAGRSPWRPGSRSPGSGLGPGAGRGGGGAGRRPGRSRPGRGAARRSPARRPCDISRVRPRAPADVCIQAPPARPSCAVPASTSARTRRGCSSRTATPTRLVEIHQETSLHPRAARPHPRRGDRAPRRSPRSSRSSPRSSAERARSRRGGRARRGYRRGQARRPTARRSYRPCGRRAGSR